MHRYAAFISYASRYAKWVERFQRDLERCLVEAGADPHQVWLDRLDLAAGPSWVDQLQEGLADARHLVLVITPEAMASPRVADEWQALVAADRRWAEGRLVPVLLVETPLPPLLEKIQHVDMREPARYHEGLREVVGALLGRRTRRDLPPLPADIPDPPAVDPGLDPELRAAIVAWLAPHMTRAVRRSLAAAVGLDRRALDRHPTQECAALALLVHHQGGEEPVPAAQRLLRLAEDALDDKSAEARRKLQALQEKLQAALARRPASERAGGLLPAWLAHVRQAHANLAPFFQRDADHALLERVYVELDLEWAAHAPGLVEGARPPVGPLRLRALLDLDPAKYPWITRRWVLLGHPGAGKSTLLRHLAFKLAGEENAPWVPVFASLRRLVADREFLLDRLARQLERCGQGRSARGLPALLDGLGHDGHLLLLLDGLDEVPAEDRAEADLLLRSLAERWPASPVVVSTRPIGYQRPAPAFREVHLRPLSREARTELLARWLGRRTDEPDWRRARATVDVLRVEPSLWELSGNPLYLSLMAMLVEQGRGLARRRTQLYDSVFALLLEGRHREPPLAVQRPRAVREALRHLAFGMTRDDVDQEPRDALVERLYRPDAREVLASLEALSRWGDDLRCFLDDVADRTAILAPYDGELADWRWCHRTFREALAAEALAELDRAGGRDTLLDHARSVGAGGQASTAGPEAAIAAADPGRWAEPYALLAGRVEDPDALVLALVEANRALGLRALATAEGLKEETLERVLGLTGDSDQRARVFRQVPELLSEADRALSLLERLRRRTRDGDDLYHLWAAMEAVAARHRTARKEVQDCLERFYDHVPPPDPDLFLWIERPGGERIPAWAEVPAGRFMMGSPEDEEGALPYEHPRHAVRFVAGFRVGVVPVTNRQYAAFDPNHRRPEWSGVDPDELPWHPVVGVSWHAAVAFCRWLGRAVPALAGVRLPTEAEWEYACRAGTETAYWSGNEEGHLARVGWYTANSGMRTHRVAELPANPWGLHDVHGNVWEWTASPWTGEYRDRAGVVHVDPRRPPPAPPGGARLVVRGGSFGVVARWARSAYRYLGRPSLRGVFRGFRLVAPSPSEGGS